MHYQHFKMASLLPVKYILQKEDFFYKVDLQDAYFCK